MTTSPHHGRPGDGIGPEIMDATLSIRKGAGAAIDIEPIEICAKVYLRGVSARIVHHDAAG